MLPLQEITLRRLVVILWNGYDILASIGKHHIKSMLYCEFKSEWCETVESKVITKISKLALPDLLTEQMIQIAKPIGLQIRRWKWFHEKYLSDSREEFDVPVLTKLCWTSEGKVDYQRTAEEIIRCKIVDIVKLYKLACLYCLEDYIPVFWKEIPEEIKKTFQNEENTSDIETPHLQFCWPYILKGEVSKLDYLARKTYGNPSSFHQRAFEYSARKGNKTAAVYFFLKLTFEEREASLIRTTHYVVAERNFGIYRYPDDFPKENISDVLYYLLSLMTPEQHMEIFKVHRTRVLRCFLGWPWQDLFLEISDLMWDFLPASDYSGLLLKMFLNFKYSEPYLPKLFQEFFMRSPVGFKKHFAIKERLCRSFFPYFFDFKDSETIKVIFRSLDAADRMSLVSSESLLELFCRFISRGRWHMVEVCLRGAALSEENKDRLKETFGMYLAGIDRGHIKWRKRKWRRFFQFLDEADENALGGD
ncbi:hypothetical protein HNY73_007702 [Argiope bruennichi]|uniref:Uncharacterized protein n=2 Tax=Argiope bruennichi TaxID=94029 RepID=A0A8T0FJS8_ARGBR|nr:hypothetical protein HNY73_007702 [Argiope bruennichi]